MKYIMVKPGGSLFTFPIMFDEFIQHSDIDIHGFTAVSAGYVHMVDGQWCCGGEAASLGLTSKVKKDTLVIRQVLGKVSV